MIKNYILLKYFIFSRYIPDLLRMLNHFMFLLLFSFSAWVSLISLIPQALITQMVYLHLFIYLHLIHYTATIGSCQNDNYECHRCFYYLQVGAQLIYLISCLLNFILLHSLFHVNIEHVAHFRNTISLTNRYPFYDKWLILINWMLIFNA